MRECGPSLNLLFRLRAAPVWAALDRLELCTPSRTRTPPPRSAVDEREDEDEWAQAAELVPRASRGCGWRAREPGRVQIRRASRPRRFTQNRADDGESWSSVEEGSDGSGEARPATRPRPPPPPSLLSQMPAMSLSSIALHSIRQPGPAFSTPSPPPRAARRRRAGCRIGAGEPPCSRSSCTLGLALPCLPLLPPLRPTRAPQPDHERRQGALALPLHSTAGSRRFRDEISALTSHSPSVPAGPRSSCTVCRDVRPAHLVPPHAHRLGVVDEQRRLEAGRLARRRPTRLDMGRPGRPVGTSAHVPPSAERFEPVERDRDLRDAGAEHAGSQAVQGAHAQPAL